MRPVTTSSSSPGSPRGIGVRHPSTNPRERVNKEIKRRTDVVGVFPNPTALVRLAGSVLIEQHQEWEAGDRRYFSSNSMLVLATMNAITDTSE
jgi:transposase-like protein